MIPIPNFIKLFSSTFSQQVNLQPWKITKNLPDILLQIITGLGDEYTITDGVAIHRTATVEQGAVLKAPIIISENCFVGANAYLRGGVYLGKAASVGPGCEIKTSIIFDNTHLAHFNFLGDSLIGSNVNFEAGAITANHFNERADKTITVLYNSTVINTGCVKFGALVGDSCKIGANAVLSPGTIFIPDSVVKRLELVEQIASDE